MGSLDLEKLEQMTPEQRAEMARHCRAEAEQNEAKAEVSQKQIEELQKKLQALTEEKDRYTHRAYMLRRTAYAIEHLHTNGGSEKQGQ